MLDHEYQADDPLGVCREPLSLHFDLDVIEASLSLRMIDVLTNVNFFSWVVTELFLVRNFYVFVENSL